MNIDCYAAKQAGKTVEKFSYAPADLANGEVEIEISHCGICHSDLHLIANDWGISSYPLVPGHEIVGTLAKKSSGVDHLKIGQRVGVGWQKGACMTCDYCVNGQDNLCGSQQGTCLGSFGGFAEKIRLDSQYVFPIPDNLESENAAPLLCGGVTVYSPLKQHGVRPSMKIGVIGIGGLGHLALQYANAMGCEVTAFSHSPDKEAEARKFGAHHFIASNDPDGLATARNSLDFILNTAFADLDWAAYIGVLRANGKLVIVGVPPSDLKFNGNLLLFGQKSIGGSMIGSRGAIREMLEFSVRNNIKAQTELMPMTEVNAALTRLEENKARYRIVLKN